MSSARAVLLDLWDTTAWGEMPTEEERLTTQLGVSEGMLYDAFELTRDARGTGEYGSPEEDLASVAQACGLALDPDDVRRITDVHIAWLKRGVHLYDDTLPVLRELRGRGMQTAIISNCDHFTRPAVEALGLEGEVDTLILSFEVGALKPDPIIYRVALERLHAVAADAIFVDDQAEYCDGAAALGMRTFRIDREEAGLDPNGHTAIRDLHELLDLM